MSITPAVEDNEVLFRQIPEGGNPLYFDADRQLPVHWVNFKPNKSDTDGLSLIRALYRKTEWAAFRPQVPEKRFRLVAKELAQLNEIAHSIGLGDLQPTPSPDKIDEQTGEPWAHSHLAALNYHDYTERKSSFKEWAMHLERSVSKEDVLGPFDPPDQNQDPRPK